MRIAEALRLPVFHENRIAFVGAGGKTTAMFHLARELAPVLITTSTHLGVWQAEAADRHIPWLVGDPLPDLGPWIDKGITLMTGGQDEHNRLRGLTASQLAQVDTLASSHDLMVLVEADGAQQRPLKAPAAHEPAIPPFVNLVVLVAGLSAIGKPLTADWVHRPERFSDLSYLAPGQEITPEALATVLTHPEGGLKNIPSWARRVVLLTQADTVELQATTQSMAPDLIQSFNTVISASFAPTGGGEAPAASDRKTEPEIHAVYEPASGIILAAGGASRYGQPKQLLAWDGETFVHRVARTALEAGLSPVIVVTGAGGSEVAAAVNDLHVRIADNPEWQTGQGSSVQTGLQAVPPECGSALFLLVDQPQIPSTLVRALLAEHARTLAPIVAPLVDGRRGNPVLFDRITFPELLSLSGDTGGRALFSRHPVTWLPWHDASVLVDVDTVEDYRRLVENSNRSCNPEERQDGII